MTPPTAGKDGENKVGDPNEIVGHKTLRDENDQLYHEPLTRAEADKIIAACDAAQAARTARYPTAEDAVRGMCEAFIRLKELGWREAIYAPADGELKRIVEAGSSGIHEGYCERRHDRPDEKWWWVPSPGDLWPSKPVLYLPSEKENAEREARFAKARAEIDKLTKGQVRG